MLCESDQRRKYYMRVFFRLLVVVWYPHLTSDGLKWQGKIPMGYQMF